MASNAISLYLSRSGQLRGNLIFSKYKGGLYRVILTADGEAVIPQSNPPLPLVGNLGLGVTQAPDGTLVEIRHADNSVWIHRPKETATTKLIAKSVFPRRGGRAGGTPLTIYGVNLNKNGNPTVRVGGSSCPVTFVSATKLRCTIPGGTGTVDVVVTSGAESYTFQKGYRFILGAGR